MYSMCLNALKSFFFLIPKCPILGQRQLLQSVSCPFDGTPLVLECLFTVAQDVPASSSMFPASDLNQTFFPTNVASFSSGRDLIQQRRSIYICFISSRLGNNSLENKAKFCYKNGLKNSDLDNFLNPFFFECL